MKMSHYAQKNNADMIAGMPLFLEERYPTTCEHLPDGSMMVTGTIACRGVLRYICGDCIGPACGECAGKGFVLEAVDDDVLSDAEWLRTIGTAPIVLEHPPGRGNERLLTPENIERFQDPAYDGPGKIVPGGARAWFDPEAHATKIELRLFSSPVLDGISKGVFDLSPGHIPRIDRSPGIQDGIAFDRRQASRMGNHTGLILAKPYGGLGSREPMARFDSRFDDAGEPVQEPQMDQAAFNALFLAALADPAFAVQVIEALKSAQAAPEAPPEAPPAEPNPEMAEMQGRMDALETKLARVDAAGSDGKDAPPDEDDKKKEMEARADAADEDFVRTLAGHRKLDVTQPVATLRGLLLAGTSYESARRGPQRAYIETLAGRVLKSRVDANDPQNAFDRYFQGMARLDSGDVTPEPAPVQDYRTLKTAEREKLRNAV